MTVSLSDVLEGHKNISCVLLTPLKRRKQKNYPSSAQPRSDMLKKVPLSDTSTVVAGAKQYFLVEIGKDSITRLGYVMTSTDRSLDFFSLCCKLLNSL